MFLLDTDILSALQRRGRHPEVVGWLEGQRTVDLHLSVVTDTFLLTNAEVCCNAP